MQAAAIGLHYDIIVTPLHGHSSKHADEPEEKRTSVMSVTKIYKGKIAQTDIVVDTAPFKAAQEGKEVSCLVM